MLFIQLSFKRGFEINGLRVNEEYLAKCIGHFTSVIFLEVPVT